MDFREVFPMAKPVIGMIHLAGEDPVGRAVREMEIYADEGVDGVIIEDFHGSIQDVADTLEFINSENIGKGLVKGVNILSDPYTSFGLAHISHCDFIQFDNISPSALNMDVYKGMREDFSDIVVLGGVRFKYQLSTGKSLEQDIADAKPLCEAIVTTGEGTGRETPLQKLRDFRRAMGDYTLIVGAGVNVDNAYDQMRVADGAIVGSGYKPGKDTHLMVESALVRGITEEIKRARLE